MDNITIFTAVTAAAVVLQAGVLVGILLAVRKTSTRIESLAQEVRTKALPTLESAQAIFDHREIRLLCVTGGPAVGRAALRSPKRAIVAGPGNPPVVVDEKQLKDVAVKVALEEPPKKI